MPEQLTKKDLEPILSSINRIEFALLGDDKMQIEGIVHKVKKHEKHVNNAHKRAGILTGVSATAGVLLHQVWQYFTGNK